MNESSYHNLLGLIRQGKASIEINRFSTESFFKSLWLKFACAYVKFRAVRDYEFFQEAYRSKLASLHLGDGRIVSYPTSLEEALEEQPQ